MKTRKDYLDGKHTHREYYAQFVTEGLRNVVKSRIGLTRLMRSTCEHFNDIPLQEWDAIQPPLGYYKKMEEAGDYATPAGCVCIVKEAARQVVEQNS